MTPDAALFESPAIPLLVTLEARGCRLTVTADGGRLIVEPASRLTATQREDVREHGRTLATLIRACDDGVQARRECFAAQFDATPVPQVPAFLFRSNVPYQPGVCFSCAESLPEPRFGRCWRCALAWRLVGLRTSVETAAALDAARVA